MGKYKICVYAICKNEVKFVKRWYDSVKSADSICVLDTGSDDGSYELLSALGVKVVRKEIKPWRFDVARNESMKLIPDDTDICVCVDFDEVFCNEWRDIVEASWNENVNRIAYRYVWNFKSDGSEDVVFFADKIHRFGNYEWIHPVHEVLKYSGTENYITVSCPELSLYHYADTSKDRKQYLELLELSVKEDSTDDRNMHYLGREYMFRGRWDDAISTLKRHLQMKKAVWKDERSASMRYIARCYSARNDKKEALSWYLKSIAEAPDVREPYIETAKMLLENGEYHGAAYFSQKALAITERSYTYISESSAWEEEPYDILSVCCYYLGDIANAYEYVRTALLYAPDNERIKNNEELIKKYYL